MNMTARKPSRARFALMILLFVYPLVTLLLYGIAGDDTAMAALATGDDHGAARGDRHGVSHHPVHSAADAGIYHSQGVNEGELVCGDQFFWSKARKGIKAKKKGKLDEPASPFS